MTCAKLGARVCLWDINQKDLEKTAAEVEKATKAEGENAVSWFCCDISNREKVYEAAAKVKAEIGDPYCVVNNAGILSGQRSKPHRRCHLSQCVASPTPPSSRQVDG